MIVKDERRIHVVVVVVFSTPFFIQVVFFSRFASNVPLCRFSVALSVKSAERLIEWEGRWIARWENGHLSTKGWLSLSHKSLLFFQTTLNERKVYLLLL